MAADGTYAVTSSSALANGRHTVTAGEVSPAGTETLSTGSLAFTVDTVGPSVTAKAPGVTSFMVSQTSNVTATFSEPIAGLGTASFTLKNPAGAVIAAPVTWNATTRVATLNPNATLAADQKHTATLTAGITDIAGNPIAANSGGFTTGPRPTVVGRTPAAGATRISRTANVTATTSERVTGVTTGTFALRKAGTTAVIPAVVSYNATTRVATLNPSVTLAANTTYTAVVSTNIRDLAGNSLLNTSWSFTTCRRSRCHEPQHSGPVLPKGSAGPRRVRAAKGGAKSDDYMPKRFVYCDSHRIKTFCKGSRWRRESGYVRWRRPPGFQ